MSPITWKHEARRGVKQAMPDRPKSVQLGLP